VAFAKRVLARVPATLYARVDMVLTSRGPELMELELVEPQLFFRTAPGAADRAAGLILDTARRATLPDAM
jgi:hypothetical protein